MGKIVQLNVALAALDKTIVQLSAEWLKKTSGAPGWDIDLGELVVCSVFSEIQRRLNPRGDL